MAERTVEVLIKARDEATQPLVQLVQAFGSAAKSSEQFTEDLAKTDKRFGELQASGAALRETLGIFSDLSKAAVKALSLNDALAKTNETLVTQAAKLRETRAAQQQASAASAEAVSNYTRQEAALAALQGEQAAVAGRQKELVKLIKEAGVLDKASADVAAYEASLATLGAESDALSAKQSHLVAEISRVNQAIAQSKVDFKTSFSADQGALEQRQAQLLATIEKLSSKGFASLTAQVDKYENKLATLGAESASLTGQQGALATKIAEVNRVLSMTKAGPEFKESLTAARDELTKNLADIDTALVKNSTQVIEAEANLQKVIAKVTEFADKASKAGVDIREMGRPLESLKADLAGVQAELARMGAFNKAVDGMASARTQLVKDLGAVNKAIDGNAATTSSTEKKLQGVIEKMAALGEAATKRGVDVRELVRPLDELQAELAAVEVEMATFAGKSAPLEGALANAKAKVTETATAVRESINDLKSAERAHESTAKAVTDLTAKLQPLESQLTAAGVDTGNLAKEQDRLQSEMKQTATEVRKAEGSLQKYAGSAAKAAGANESFLEKGRKALSFTQRLRGQVLSLISAYVGLYGVVNQVQRAFQVGTELQGARNTLLAATGNDARLAAQEFEYARGVAERLGQEYGALVKQYAKLRVAAKEAGISVNAQRVIFESMTEAATVLRMTTDQTERVFYAITQIFSKGKITAEELTQQLGDNLVGAMPMLAKGLGITEKALMDMMKAGELTSEALIALAIQSKTTFGEALAKALTSPQAELNRLKNRVTELRDVFFQSAERNGLADAIRNLTKEISTPELEQGVTSLARLFVDLLRAIPQVVQVLSDVMPLIKAFVYFWVGSKLAAGIGAAATALTTRLIPALAGTATTLTAVQVAVLRTQALLATFLGTFSLTTWARKEFDGFRKWTDRLGAILIHTFVLVGNVISHGLKIFLEALYELVTAPITALRGGKIFEYTEREIKAFVEASKKQLEDLSNAWDVAGAPPAGETNAAGQPAGLVDTQRGPNYASAEAERQILEANAILEGALADRVTNEKDASKKAANARLQAEKDVNDKILESRQDLAEQLANLSGDPKAELAAQLSGIDEKYRETYDKIALMRAEEAGKARAQLDAIVAQEKDLARAQASTRGGLVQELKDSLAEATGDGAKVELEKLGAEFEQTVAQLRLMGREDGIAIATELFNVDAAKIRLDDMTTEYDRVMSKFSEDSARVADLVAIGSMTQIEGQTEINRLRAEALTQVQAMIPAMEALAAATRNPEIIANVQRMKDSLVDLRKTGVETMIQRINEDLAGGFTDALDQWVMGVASAKDAFSQFAADFLRRIAKMIIQQQTLNMLQNMTKAGGVWGGIIGSVAKAAGTMHDGGIVGRDWTERRMVNPAIFANAQRYHSGGMVGLRADEVPAILQRGEQVLAKNDPSNALNGGGRPVQVKVVNTIDSGDFVSQGLATSQGTEMVLNIIRSNRGALV